MWWTLRSYLAPPRRCFLAERQLLGDASSEPVGPDLDSILADGYYVS